MSRSMLVTAVSLCLGWAAQGQVISAEPLSAGRRKHDGPKEIMLSLAAAPEPRPALRYLLRHKVIDQVPGNAALAYKSAEAQFLNAASNGEPIEQVRDWLKAPPHKVPRKEAQALVDQFEPTLRTLSRAARYEDCDWQLPLREEGFALVIPHLQNTRALARVLALRARLHIAAGRFDEALADIRTGLTLGRHVGNSATLIEGLVGIAIAQVMLDRVEEFIDAPGAPNLYWALTELTASPLFSFRDAMQWEQSMVYVHAPALADLDGQGITSEQYHEALGEMMSLSGRVGGSPAASSDQRRLVGTGLALAVYPRACRALGEEGYTTKEIEAMPVAQVVTRYLLGSFAYRRDELFKWVAVPFPDAHRGMLAAQLELKEAMAEDPIANALPGMLLPAVTHASARFAEIDRKVAALRCIEALRLHAVDSGGHLPDKLARIDRVPIPEDPLTGNPFAYRTTAEGALLELLALPGDRPGRGRTYIITMEP